MDTFSTKSQLDVNGKKYSYFSLSKAAKAIGDISRLPFSLKVLLENLLRFEDGVSVTADDINALIDWQKLKSSTR